MEHARELGDKSEIESLLDNVRKEKDILEGQVATLQEQLSRSQCEVSKLREQLSSLQEECKVISNEPVSSPMYVPMEKYCVLLLSLCPITGDAK